MSQSLDEPMLLADVVQLHLPRLFKQNMSGQGTRLKPADRQIPKQAQAGTLRLWDPPTIRVRPSHPRVPLEQLDPTLRSKARGLIAGELRWPLYLWSGQTGTGKTTAALMLLDRAFGPSEFGFFPQLASDTMWGLIDYRRFPSFLEGCSRNAYTWSSCSAGGPLTEAKVWNTIAKAALIVIDDVSELPPEAGKFGHDHRGFLKQILDLRCQRPTIITGNLSPWPDRDGEPSQLMSVLDTGGIDRVNDRIVSGTAYEMPGKESLRWG